MVNRERAGQDHTPALDVLAFEEDASGICSRGKARLGLGPCAERRRGREGGHEEDREDRGDRGDPWHLAPRVENVLRCARAITELKGGQGLQIQLQRHPSRTNFPQINFVWKFLEVDGSDPFMFVAGSTSASSARRLSPTKPGEEVSAISSNPQP